MREHFVDPDVAVLHHYRRCPLAKYTPSQCRELISYVSHTRPDDTILKYRDQLATAVSRKLADVL